MPWRANQGEYAFVIVEVDNTSGVLLRDVVVDFNAYWPASVAPLTIWGIVVWDGEEYWDELEPGDSRSFAVRLMANAAGTALTHMAISGEVIPYATRPHAAWRNIAIYPA